MSNKPAQPTAEQLKKFWEWCGFRWEWGKPKDEYGVWYDPEGNIVDSPPQTVDLNNLFKYPMPKLDDAQYYIALRSLKARSDNPALALFWAIWEVVNNKESHSG